MADLETRGVLGSRDLSVAAVMMPPWMLEFMQDRLWGCLVNERFDALVAGGLLCVGGELRELCVEIGERPLELFAVTRALAGL